MESVMKMNGNSKKVLEDTVTAIAKKIEERDDINADIADIKATAKAAGFDPKTVTEMVKLKRMDAALRDEKETMRQMYIEALKLV